MTDYTRQLSGGSTHFGDKDELSSGDPEKVIVGTQFDTEFNAIVTHSATKYDVADLATKIQAEQKTLNTVLMTPLRTQEWADTWKAENAGIIGDLHALTAPGADQLLAYDFGTTSAKGFTLGAGLEFSGDTVQLAAAIAGDGLDFATQVLSLTDITAGANQPITLSGTTWGIDLTALDNMEGSALAATDEIMVDNGGTTKAIAVQDMGLRVQTGQATQTLAAADMNSIMEFTATATLTLPKNTTTDLPVGVPIILNMKHATQELTVTAATDVTLVSIYHPGGASAESDTVNAGGTAILYKTATDVWAIAGDIGT